MRRAGRKLARTHSDLRELQARLTVLEEERSIQRRLYAYGHAIDYGDEDEWVDCFTEDGVFDVRGRLPGHTALVVSGREALREFAAGHTRPPERYHKHLVIQPVIALEGDRATCTSYFLVVMEHEGRPVLRVFGRYRDRLVKEEGGRWRFEERVAEIESMRPGLPPLAYGREGEGGR